jgi:RecB family exonuclease
VGGDRTVLVDALQGAIEAARRARDLEPVTVVTPSVHSSFYLRRALGVYGLFNIRFSRLDDLAEELAGAAGRRPPLTRLIAHELVAAVVADRSVALPAELDRVRDHPSLAAAMHRTLDLLGCAPEGLLEELAAVGQIQRGVVALFRAYQARATGYEQRLDVAERAASMVRSDPQLIARRLGAVIFVDVEPPSQPYRAFADAIRASPGAVAVTAEPGWPDSMKLVSAPDPVVEVRWVVRNCMSLVRQGSRFGDIAVYYDDPAYGTRLEDAFRLAGIPVSGPDPTPFADRPEGRFLLGALECLGPSAQGPMALRREAVMAWLTSSPVAPPQTREAFHASRWDAVSRNAGVVRGIESWRASLSGYADRLERRASTALALDEIDAPTAAAINAEANEARALLAFAEELAARARPPDDGVAWSAFAAWARDVTARYMGGAADDRAAERKVWLDDLFDRMAELDSVVEPAGSKGPTFERFSAVVREELSRPMRSTRSLGRGVFVAPIGYAPGTWFDAAHVVGMTEGRFPTAPAYDALLPDEVRIRVDRQGEWLENHLTNREKQRARLLGAIWSGRRAFLLWPRAEPGAARRSWPAQWFVEAARHRGGEAGLQASTLIEKAQGGWLEVVANAYDAVASGSADSCADEHEYDLRSSIAWRRQGGGVETHFLARLADDRLARGVRLARSRFAGDWTEFDGNLTSRPGGRTAIDEAIGPTRLEAWAACPFRYFLAYVLKLAALPRPEEVFTMAPLDRGSLVHRILQDYFAERGTASPEDRGAVMSRVARAALDAAPSRYVVGKAALWSLTRDEIERGLLEFVTRETERESATGLRQVHAELRFGLRGTGAPRVAVDLGGGRELAFRGVIDRVELSADGRRGAVVDYKTGSPKPYGRLEEDPVDRGKRLQLPVYVHALRALQPGLESVTAQYWFVGARGGFTLIPEAGIGDSEAMVRAARVIVGGIDAGIYVARPGGREERGFENCMFCDFDRVCPGARDRIWERKRSDPAVAMYRDLSEPL